MKITGEKAKEFEDMREVFADPGVDAVSIATPNHWHALATIWACKAGKDVYCEKPACYNIHEGQMMVQVARETKRMVQIGSQHRSTPFKMKGMEALHGGMIGKVYMAKGLCYKRRVSIGHKADAPTPPGVNWDLFLGPAPMRAFQRTSLQIQLALVLGHRQRRHRQPGRPRDGHCALGYGRSGMAEDRSRVRRQVRAAKTIRKPPTRCTANFDFGGREMVFEVRGLLTGGEGMPPAARRPAANAPAAETAAMPAGPANPVNVTVGNLFYGTEGWMSMNDAGYQIYKGESSELMARRKSGKGTGHHPAAHGEFPLRGAFPQVQRSARWHQQRLPERFALPPGEYQLSDRTQAHP